MFVMVAAITVPQIRVMGISSEERPETLYPDAC